MRLATAAGIVGMGIVSLIFGLIGSLITIGGGLFLNWNVADYLYGLNFWLYDWAALLMRITGGITVLYGGYKLLTVLFVNAVLLFMAVKVLFVGTDYLDES